MLRPRDDLPWTALADLQHGAVTRAQLLDLGVSVGAVRGLVGSGRFQKLYRGVFATFSGPVPWRTTVSAAVLSTGRDSAVAGRTALQLAGVLDAPTPVIELCIPADRRVTQPPGLTVVTRANLAEVVQQVPWPPRLRLEEAVLDVAERQPDEAGTIAVLLAAVQRRRTTPARLRAALTARPRYRGRELLTEGLTEAADGVRSLLERRYLRGVERAHGLPQAVRQHRDVTARGVRYRDLRYEEQQVVVELDGEIAHPETARRRDNARGRGIVLAGDVPLVYGWLEVVGTPCQVAAEVAAVLVARGWFGSPHPCGPTCTLPLTGLPPG